MADQAAPDDTIDLTGDLTGDLPLDVSGSPRPPSFVPPAGDVDGSIGGLTRLAARVCGMPMGATVLVESGRAVYVATAGHTDRSCSPAPATAASRLAIDVARAGRSLAAADTGHDLGGVRSYAGAPLLTADGVAIGALIVADAVAHPISDEERDALESVAWQVTVLLQLRAELQAAASGWAERDRLLSELRTANERLWRANAFQQDIAAITGHELRSPLTGLMGSVETLLRQWEHLDPATCQQLLELASRSAHRISGVAGDLYQVAETAAGAVHAEGCEIDLGGLVAEIVADSDVDGVTVVCHRPVVAWATARHVVQILCNLLTNADRYGTPPIVVTVERGGRAATVTVDDNGPGVDAGLAGRLFGRYQRGTHTVEGSAGLGLAIVAALVNANAGYVTYEPRSPVGSRFTVTLPASRPRSE